MSKTFGILTLHVLVLWNLAVAQPLLDVLAKGAPFFVAHRSTPAEILILVALVCVIAPCGVVALLALARVLRVPRAAELVVLAALAGVVALLWAKRLGGDTASVHVAAALVAGCVFAAAYHRLAPVRLFVTCLSPGLVLIPLAFLWGPDVSKLVFPRQSQPAREPGGAINVPVVLVVFDELPLTSLLNRNWQIDADAYPNFARFARDSSWFRNTTSVSDSTISAIPAILTGGYPAANHLPIAADYPGTLFSLLEGSHEVHALESGTQLCPPTLCVTPLQEGPEDRRLASLIRDVGVVYLHIVLPARFAAQTLPALGNGWAYFGDAAEADAFDTPDRGDKFLEAFGGAANAMDRAIIFERFVDAIAQTQQPGLHYLHTMVAHVPWRQFPSGRLYDHDDAIDGLLPNDTWVNDPIFVDQAYHRHLLQVRFADRLLGTLLDRLTALDLYDRALIVIAADHGSSFRPGDHRRRLTQVNLADIVSVPLFIKLPGQRSGVVSDSPVETIDVLPTIADALGIPIPWNIDGRSVFTPLDSRTRAAFDTNFQAFPIPSEPRLPAETLARKFSVVGGTGPQVQWPGPVPGLVGRSTNELALDTSPGLSMQLEDEALLHDVDLRSEFLPAHIRGVIHGRLPSERAGLAVAVNGLIRATTWTFVEDGAVRFSAVVPEEALQPGANAVDVFLLPPGGSAGRLRAIAQESELGYELRQSPDGGETIVDRAGRSFSVVSNNSRGLRGHVDRWQRFDRMAHATGWAADVWSHPADTIVAFADGRFAGLAHVSIDRPDVARTFGQDGLLRSGFAISVLPQAQSDFERAEVRLFAIASSGIATELVNPVDGITLGRRF